MTTSEFYKRWFLLVVRRPLQITDGVASAIGVLGAAAIHFYPQTRAAIENLYWQIPVGLVAALALSRVFLAPYWIYKDQFEFAVRLARRIRNLNTKIAELEGALQQRANRREIRQQLDRFIADGNRLLADLANVNENVLDQTNDVMDWAREVYRHIGGEPFHRAAWMVSGLNIEEDLVDPALSLFSFNKREASKRMQRQTLVAMARLADSATERTRLRTILQTMLERLSRLLEEQPLE